MTESRAAMSAAALGLALLGAPAGGAGAAEKVVYDTDLDTMGDDGQAFVMLVQAVREAKVELLGLTLVGGNRWLDQEAADAPRAVERTGVADEVEAHAGALHTRSCTTGPRWSWSGSCSAKATRGRGASRSRAGRGTSRPRRTGSRGRSRSRPGTGSTSWSTRSRPTRGEVTILAVGPLTNLALAFRENPEVVPPVRRIVYMGGAVEVPGNVTPAAESSWWSDPEAARIVLRRPIEHAIVPPDVTDGAGSDEAVSDRIGGAGTPVAGLFAETFATDPKARAQLWDAVAATHLPGPALATGVREPAVDIDTTFGPNHGRSPGRARNPPAGPREAEVVFAVDLDRSWTLYADLPPRPAAGGG